MMCLDVEYVEMMWICVLYFWLVESEFFGRMAMGMKWVKLCLCWKLVDVACGSQGFFNFFQHHPCQAMDV